MSDQNIAVARAAFEPADRFGGNALPTDIEAQLPDELFAPVFDPEVVWVPASQSPLGNEVYRGFDGVRRFWTDFLVAWDEYRAEAIELQARGDRVAAVMRVTGRVHGVELDELWSCLFEIHDGLITRVEPFTTPEGALEAAG